MALKGVKFTEEHKQKLSDAKKGIAPKCSGYNKGKHLSEATKKKISNTKKGTVIKNHFTWKGLKRPPITKKWREKLRVAHIGKNMGAKNPSWKGGVTPLARQIRHCFKNRQWISDVFTRDDYTCANCGARGYKLNAHHIKSFSHILKEYSIKTLNEALDCEELWNINNGITLCEKCHHNK